MFQLPKRSQAKNCITYSAQLNKQNNFHLPAIEKCIQSFPKDKILMLVSFLFDRVSLGHHAHLTFLSQHYLLLSLTFFTEQFIKRLNSVLLLFTIQHWIKMTYRQGTDSSCCPCPL